MPWSLPWGACSSDWPPSQSSLNFSWHSFIPLPCVLSLVTKERSASPPPLLPWGSCKLQWGQLSDFSSPSWRSQVTSAVPRKSCPPDLSPSWLTSFYINCYFFCWRDDYSWAHRLYQNQTRNHPSTLKSEKVIRPSSRLTSKNRSLGATGLPL